MSVATAFSPSRQPFLFPLLSSFCSLLPRLPGRCSCVAAAAAAAAAARWPHAAAADALPALGSSGEGDKTWLGAVIAGEGTRARIR